MASIMYESPALVVLGSVVELTESETFFVSCLDVPPDTSGLVPSQASADGEERRDQEPAMGRFLISRLEVFGPTRVT